MTDRPEEDAIAYRLVAAIREEAAKRGRDPLMLAALVIVRDNRPMVESWLADRAAKATPDAESAG